MTHLKTFPSLQCRYIPVYIVAQTGNLGSFASSALNKEEAKKPTQNNRTNDATLTNKN